MILKLSVMKATMKNNGHINKIRRSARKITMNLILASLVLVFASCEKEEIFEPDQKVHEVDESVKATSRLVPNLSLEIGFWGIRAPYDCTLENRTVRFNGSLLSATSTIVNGGRVSNQIWSSSNGRSWSLRSDDPFRIDVTNMVVHYNKVWALGTWGELGPLEAYTSSDGHT